MKYLGHGKYLSHGKLSSAVQAEYFLSLVL